MVLIAGCTQQTLEDKCSDLKKNLRVGFNNLSKNCSTDEDCEKFSMNLECLAPCSVCVNKNEDVKKLEDLESEIYNSNCFITLCSPNCVATTCKCVNNVCEAIPNTEISSMLSQLNIELAKYYPSGNELKVIIRNKGNTSINVAKLSLFIDNELTAFSSTTGTLLPGEIIFLTVISEDVCNETLKIVPESGFEDYATIQC